MASLVYNSAIYKVLTGAIDFDTDTFYAMLVTATYTPDVDAHDFRNDVTNEVSGAGYTADGQAVAVTVTQDNANNRIDVEFDPVTWSTATITARAAVIYKHRGGASSADELICYADFGGNVASTGGDFVATFTSPLRFQMP